MRYLIRPSHLLRALLLTAVAAGLPAHGADWRDSGSDAAKLSKLVELVPNTAIWMQQMGHRYGDLYYAAKQGKWDFAAYQAEEIEKLIAYVATARPKRAASALAFRDAIFPSLHQVIEQRDWSTFEPAFALLSSECMSCHVDNDHAFVVLPMPPRRHHSPVLDE